MLLSSVTVRGAQLVLTAMLFTTAMNSITVFQPPPERIKTRGIFHATLTDVALAVLDARKARITVCFLVREVKLIMVNDTFLIIKSSIVTIL